MSIFFYPSQKTQKSAEKARDAGLTMYAIGVGKLTEIALHYIQKN